MERGKGEWEMEIVTETKRDRETKEKGYFNYTTITYIKATPTLNQYMYLRYILDYSVSIIKEYIRIFSISSLLWLAFKTVPTSHDSHVTCRPHPLITFQTIHLVSVPFFPPLSHCLMRAWPSIATATGTSCIARQQKTLQCSEDEVRL